MSVTTSANKKSVFDGRKMWFIFGALAAALVAVLVFVLMSDVTKTETYYVLNSDVPARTVITSDLLVEVTVAAGAVPSNSLHRSEILGGANPMYALYPLKARDVLTASNIGELLPLTQGLPEDFVVASFQASPNVSAAGNIKRGDYIDIIVISSNDPAAGEDGVVATYVLQHVLVVEAKIDLNTVRNNASSDSSNSTPVTTGSSVIPMLYTVGLTQEHALVLAVATQYDLYVVLSSRSAVEGNINDFPGRMSSGNIWGEDAPDAGWGTDNTFGLSGETPVVGPRPTPSPSDGPSSPEEPSSPSNPSDAPEETEEPTTE